MPVFSDYVRYLDGVKTLIRRVETNTLRLWVRLQTEGATAVGQALSEYVDTSWPLQTASGWVLDQHWGPFYNIQRGGLSDARFRQYGLAKRRLNVATGNVDGLLVLLRELLPGATAITWTPFYPVLPKNWEVQVVGVLLTDAGPVFEFLRKRPSPEGGGYSVAGDNGYAVAADAEVLTFSSVHGAVTIAGWFSSVHGAVVGAAGWAHAVGI